MRIYHQFLHHPGLKVMKATPSGYMNWMTMIYYLVLVLLTDCLVWYTAGSLQGYTWQYLVTYSLLSYPLWIIINLKGVGIEQTELFESSKWHAVDLFPMGVTNVFLFHYLGKVCKDKWLYIWMMVYLSLSIYSKQSLYVIVLALLCLLVGACNLVLAGILTKYYSPKGYSSVLGATFRNLTWIFSGAVFPLGMISQSSWFYILNPFGASISLPISILDSSMDAGRLILSIAAFLGSMIWFLVFYFLCRKAENHQRERIYS